MKTKLIEFILQLVKFAIVGVSNVILDLCVYYVLTRYFNLYYLWAAAISFVIFVSWSFYINSRWTFQGKKLRKRRVVQYSEFILINALMILAHIYLLYIFVEFAGIYDLFGKLMTSVLVGILNFSLNKFITFNDIKLKK